MTMNMKKRLAVFLAIMLVLPVIVSMLPMTTIDVFAASDSVHMFWGWGNSEEIQVRVEQGQKFYVGDYASVHISGKTYWSGEASLVKASYASSNKAVATINGKGYLEAKRAGQTTLTVKYKGKKITSKLEVVPAGTIKITSDVTRLKEKAEEIAKIIPSKITVKNGFELNKQITAYKNYAGELTDINSAGFLQVKKSYMVGDKEYSYYASTTQLAVPQAGRYRVLESMLSDFGRKNNPTGTKSAKLLKIKSVSAKTNAVTIKLKKKIDDAQILAARISEYYFNEDVSGNTNAYVYVSLYDLKDNKHVPCIGELKKGSKTLKLLPKKYSDEKQKYLASKLKKGHTYQIERKQYWSKGKTVKVK